MIETIWKDVKDYEGLYQISNFGTVKSLARLVNYKGKCDRWQEEKILRLNPSNGYRTVSLVKDKIKLTHRVHLLVAGAFMPNPENKPYINHKDGNRWNNLVSNLEWSTNSENQKHSYNVLGNKAVNGERNGQSKIKEKDVFTIRELHALGLTQKEIADQFNISPSSIGFIINKKRWSHVADFHAM